MVTEPNIEQDNKIKSTRAMGVFSLFTSFSRILGFLREMLKSYAFGVGYLSVAFDIAFRLPNMLRALVAEGAMTQAFVPIYNKYKVQDNKQELSKSVGVIFSYLSTFLIALCIISYFLIPYIIPYILDTEYANPQNISLIIKLTQILFPYIIFMSLSSLYMALEYSNGIFWSGAFGPALLNIVSILTYIIYLLFFKKNITNVTENDIYIFAWVTLFASLIQLIFQVLVVRHANLSPIFSFKYHPILKDMLLLMIPSLFSVGMQQISQLIDIYQASSLQNKVPEAISALTYAQRVVQLPMGIFGVALSTSFLASFSKLYGEKKESEFIDNIFFSLRLNLFFMLPSSITLGVFAKPIISLLFERGNFNERATDVTSWALIFYAPGLVAYGMQKILISSLFARQKILSLSIMTFIALIINVILNIIFMKYIDHGGIALGSSLAAFSVCIMFFLFFYKLFSWNIIKLHINSFIKIIFINIILFVSMYIMSNYIEIYNISTYYILPIIIFFGIIYLGLAIIFKCDEIFYLKTAFIQKKK